LILRNRLKYSLSRRETNVIVMRRHVAVDGKVRTDMNYPAGFMGNVSAFCRRMLIASVEFFLQNISKFSS
jgi:ribosomal protein S4E